MNIDDNGTSAARLGVLALAAAIAGCGGGASPGMPLQSLSELNAGAAGKRDACTFSVTAGFNNTKVPAGHWLWFTSIFYTPWWVGDFHMTSGEVKIPEPSETYVVTPPGSRVSLHNKPGNPVSLNYAAIHKPHGIWWIMVPGNNVLSNHVLLNVFAWQVPSGGTNGLEQVTWTANFYSPTPQYSFSWQWGAAAYSKLPGLDQPPYNYNLLDVKPYDSNFPPYSNNYPAGTPQNATQYLEPGGDGNGVNQYTGGLSGSLYLAPCHGPAP
jgi:hypothetical protein